MKKLPVLLLASLMLLSCAACGGRAGGDGDTSAFVTTDEENVQTEAIPENEETGEAETQASDESTSAFTVFNGETYVPIPLAFVASYSAKSGTHADGIRMFSSLGDFIRNKDLPEITYCNGYDIKYAASPGWETEVKLTVYRDQGETEPERLPGDTELSILEPGRYILEYSINNTKEEDYLIQAAIFRLTVE